MRKTKNTFMKYQNIIYYSLLFLLLFSTIAYAATSTEESTPFDFNEKVEASTLKLASGGGGQPDAESDQTTDSKTDHENSSSSQRPTTPDNPQKEPEEQREPQNTELESQNKPLAKPELTTPNAKPAPNDKVPAGGNTTPASGKTKPNNHPDIEIVDIADQQNRYFTTSITHNETVTDPLYSVTVNHLDETLIAQEMKVTVNGKKLSDYKGVLSLAEGTNDIQFQVIYKQTDNKLLRVSQSYRVTLNSQDIVITTELKEKTVHVNLRILYFVYGQQLPFR